MHMPVAGSLGASMASRDMQHGTRVAHRTIAALFLASSLVLAPVSASIANAATVEQTLADSVFVNESGATGRCTIYAATNMLRRAALLNGDSDWESITTSSIPSSGGLPWNFSVSTTNATYTVSHGYLSGSTEEEKTAELQALLEENPAGIVLYNTSSNRHAVTLVGYEDGVFIAHDSLTGMTTSLDECYSVRVSNASAYWYVTSDVAEPTPSSLTGATVSVDDAVYDGTPATPAVTVTLGEDTLTEGIDYSVSYANNDAEGTATVTVTGMGDYSGTLTATFEVRSGADVLAEQCSGDADVENGTNTETSDDASVLSTALLGTSRA